MTLEGLDANLSNLSEVINNQTDVISRLSDKVDTLQAIIENMKNELRIRSSEEVTDDVFIHGKEVDAQLPHKSAENSKTPEQEKDEMMVQEAIRLIDSAFEEELKRYPNNPYYENCINQLFSDRVILRHLRPMPSGKKDKSYATKRGINDHLFDYNFVRGIIYILSTSEVIFDQKRTSSLIMKEMSENKTYVQLDVENESHLYLYGRVKEIINSYKQ